MEEPQPAERDTDLQSKFAFPPLTRPLPGLQLHGAGCEPKNCLTTKLIVRLS